MTTTSSAETAEDQVILLRLRWFWEQQIENSHKEEGEEKKTKKKPRAYSSHIPILAFRHLSSNLRHNWLRHRMVHFLSPADLSTVNLRAQELCENRGGRPGLSVPNSPYGLSGRNATLNLSLNLFFLSFFFSSQQW